MSMPRNLVLVRHAESEGNKAIQCSENGDHGLFTEEFRKRHSSSFRLTNKGREQAKIAGAWIRGNIALEWDGYYVSPSLRALETAVLLQLPFAGWEHRFCLRERDWGDLDIVFDEEKRTKYK